MDISDKRREWYGESYDPSPHPRPSGTGVEIIYTSTGRQFGAIAAHLAAADRIIQQNFIQPAMSTISGNESLVRERALRLKQQPHSMAQNPNALHFDHRGRHRY